MKYIKKYEIIKEILKYTPEQKKLVRQVNYYLNKNLRSTYITKHSALDKILFSISVIGDDDEKIQLL